jgi:hypothetical protein
MPSRRFRAVAAVAAGLGVLLVLHGLLGFSLHSAAAEASSTMPGTVRLLPPEASVEEQEIVTVTVWLSDVANYYGIDVRLAFDSTVLTATEVVPRWDLFSEANHALARSSFSNPAGAVWYAIANENPAKPFTGTGRVCSVVFEGEDVGASPIDVTYAKGGTRDGDPIVPARVGGRVRVEPGTVSATRPLSVGWHLISQPLIPPSTALTNVLSTVAGDYDLVYAYEQSEAGGTWRLYDTSRPPYLNDLSQINRSIGFWIRITETTTLTVQGFAPVSTTIPLTTGWNLVGYPSKTTRPVTEAVGTIEGKYDLVYAFYPDDPVEAWKLYDVNRPAYLNSLAVIEPWHGLWIRVTENCTLTCHYE